jgi:hypothetical protein
MASCVVQVDEVTMSQIFSKAELNFVNNGGNLWYVAKRPDDGWDVVRWSLQHGRKVVTGDAPTELAAENKLLRYVRPSSSRTSTAIYHGIARRDEWMERMFPVLD